MGTGELLEQVDKMLGMGGGGGGACDGLAEEGG